MPDVTLPASALTAKDRDDLRSASITASTWWRSVSCRRRADLERTREVMASHGDGQTPLIAKIERPAAVENIDGILEVCRTPSWWRAAISGSRWPSSACLASRRRSPVARGDAAGRSSSRRRSSIRCGRSRRPTRAEVSDAANAVDDAVDAIMLSGETAIGVDPARTVQTLDRVIRDAEAIRPSLEIEPGFEVTDVPHNRRAVPGRRHAGGRRTGRRGGRGDAGGKTARMLSAFRPQCPIFAVTPNDVLARRLVLWRGVIAAGGRVRYDGDSDRASLAGRRLPAGRRRRRLRERERRPRRGPTRTSCGFAGWTTNDE